MHQSLTIRLLALALAVSGLAAACGSSSDNSSISSTASNAPSASTTPSPTGSSGNESLSTYKTIDDLQKAIVDAGFECDLEYDGLADERGTLSLCVINGNEQAQLTIWTDPADVTALYAESPSAATVYGANWTVDVDSGELANTLAPVVGGKTG